MTTTLNIQIIPAPENTPTWAKIIQLSASEGQGGTGKARFITGARLSIVNDEQLAEAKALLNSLDDRDYRTQCNFELHEIGGGRTNSGHATIVANLDGTQPISLWGRSTCDGPHAVFSMHAALVVEYGWHRGRGKGTVHLIGVDRSENGLGVERVPLWKFTDGDEAVEVITPERAKSFEFPAEAVEAARRKARCYHCRSAFFAKSGGAHGPSGAR